MILRQLPVPKVPFALFLDSTQGLPALNDIGMKEIARFKTLQHLGISGTLVTDAGLKELVQLDDSLQGLSLGGLQISDAGMKHLARLPWACAYLILGPSTTVTDAGMKDLARLKKLQTLGLMRHQRDGHGHEGAGPAGEPGGVPLARLDPGHGHGLEGTQRVLEALATGPCAYQHESDRRGGCSTAKGPAETENLPLMTRRGRQPSLNHPRCRLFGQRRRRRR